MLFRSAFQHRYDEADEVATAALALRAKTYIASLNQTGRVLLMEGKLANAEDLYHRTAQIGDLAKAPDDVMDSPLRIYARILREIEAQRRSRRAGETRQGCAAAKGRSRRPPAGAGRNAAPVSSLCGESVRSRMTLSIAMENRAMRG